MPTRDDEARGDETPLPIRWAIVILWVAVFSRVATSDLHVNLVLPTAWVQRVVGADATPYAIASFLMAGAILLLVLIWATLIGINVAVTRGILRRRRYARAVLLLLFTWWLLLDAQVAYAHPEAAMQLDVQGLRRLLLLVLDGTVLGMLFMGAGRRWFSECPAPARL